MADSVVRLSIESHEFDAKIKRAGEALNKYFDIAKKGDRTFAVLDEGVMDVIKSFGKMETSSKSARGQLSELTKGFTDLSFIYKRLTAEEKASPVGIEIAKSLDELKKRIQDTKKDLASINQELSGSKFGQFGGIIDDIGHKFGISANLTELLTSRTALLTTGIGASIAVIGKATEAWAAYNAELDKQDNITRVTTGLDGQEADAMTDAMRALATTYNVDFRQAVNAANTLMTQFGKTCEEAMQLLRDGMQGMILGDGGKLLSMIQQFAPAFQSAGVSAAEFVAVIQNSEGGIFTDENMRAIIMALPKIKAMSDTTAKALAGIGIDGKKMAEQIEDGSITVFQALQRVSQAIDANKEKSRETSVAMQELFGRQARTAGDKLGEAIATLNTNLEITKFQTGELGNAYAELEQANERLNKAIRDCFEYDGWESMTTEIKTDLVDALSAVVETLSKVKDFLSDIEVGKWFSFLAEGAANANIALKPLVETLKYIRGDKEGPEFNIGASMQNAKLGGLAQYLPQKEPSQEFTPIPTPSNNKSPKKQSQPKELTPLQDVQKKIADLSNEALTADDGRLEVIKQEIAALNEQVKLYKEIQDYVNGSKKISTVVGVKPDQIRQMEEELKKSFTGVNLSEMIRDMKSQISTSEIGSDFYNSLTSKIADATALQNLIKVAIENGIDPNNFNANSLWETLLSADGISDEQLQEVVDYINNFMGEHPIKLNVDTGSVSSDGKEAKESWKEAAKAVQSVGSAFANIEDPATKAMGTVMQAIASIALGFAQAASAKDTTASGWGWLAWLAAGTAAMATTIATVHSLTHFAEGGIVGGNDYTDNTPVMVSSGELILNRAQQGNLASQLQEENQTQASRLPYVTGEKVVLGINNWARSTGRGQLVFSKEL